MPGLCRAWTHTLGVIGTVDDYCPGLGQLDNSRCGGGCVLRPLRQARSRGRRDHR